MGSKFYVSLETARLLKEKGYRQTYHAYYFGDSNLKKGGYRGDSWYDSPDFYPAPTKAEAIDWLDTKEIVIEISSVRNRKWRFSIYKNGWFQIDSWIHDRLDFSTRLEAEEAAIIKALKLL